MPFAGDVRMRERRARFEVDAMARVACRSRRSRRARRHSTSVIVLLTHPDRNTQNERKATQGNAKQRTQTNAANTTPANRTPNTAYPAERRHSTIYLASALTSVLATWRRPGTCAIFRSMYDLSLVCDTSTPARNASEPRRVGSDAGTARAWRVFVGLPLYTLYNIHARTLMNDDCNLY